MGISTFCKIISPFYLSDILNRVVDAVWNITIQWGKTILQKVLFQIIMYLIVLKSESSTLSLAGSFIFFITPPFAYTEMSMRISPI